MYYNVSNLPYMVKGQNTVNIPINELKINYLAFVSYLFLPISK